jgi:hypothetical protein
VNWSRSTWDPHLNIKKWSFKFYWWRRWFQSYLTFISVKLQPSLSTSFLICSYSLPYLWTLFITSLLFAHRFCILFYYISSTTPLKFFHGFRSQWNLDYLFPCRIPATTTIVSDFISYVILQNMHRWVSNSWGFVYRHKFSRLLVALICITLTDYINCVVTCLNRATPHSLFVILILTTFTPKCVVRSHLIAHVVWHRAPSVVLRIC